MDMMPASRRLLTFTALSGELPTDLVPRLGIGEQYGEKLITSLKRDGLLKTYYRDRLRGYRLTAKGKKLLLMENPRRFSFYLTGCSDTNQPRSDYPRRLRLHQAARTYCLMANAGVTLFRDQKPDLFSGISAAPAAPFPFPAFYHSREIKELGHETVKINNSRSMGILLAENCVYPVFYTGDAVLKWEYRTEIRLKAFLFHHLRQGNLTFYPQLPGIHALLIGRDMDMAVRLMESTGGFRHSLFTLDTSFDYFHFVPDTPAGEILLRLLCSPSRQKQLSALLLSDLEPANADAVMDCDALWKGYPALLAYDFDMLRISRFLTTLKLRSQTGHIICFDFQKAALETYCGKPVTLSTIDLAKFERRFFP